MQHDMKTSSSVAPTDSTMMQLHWLPNQERRGLGTLLQGVNHVALIVSDVGRSLAFYSDVLGLQQVKRPNFDRHGAWLTAGNVELHLIKGVPLVFSGKNLIVGHIALDVPDWKEAFLRLREMEIPFELNVSVPKGTGKAESEGGASDNTLSQAFLRDPDGYYLEICNCHLLTDFCLGGKSGAGPDTVVQYKEGKPSVKVMTAAVTKMIQKSRIAKRQVQFNHSNEQRNNNNNNNNNMNHTDNNNPAEEADAIILANFIKRRLVYGDICQSFDDSELEQILKRAGNSAPRALQIMDEAIRRGEKVRVFYPPAYYVEHGARRNRYKPEPFVAPNHHESQLTSGIKNEIAKFQQLQSSDSDSDDEEKKEDDAMTMKNIVNKPTAMISDFFHPSDHHHDHHHHHDHDHPTQMHLHWFPNQERRGLGSLVTSVNHIAIIVADVGRSCAFYSDVLGLQQIKRPNFDRHGAWFTAGNVEIHLIKGEPLVHSGDNLIVGHIALDVTDTTEAYRRLREMGVSFEVNVSVPKGVGKAASEGGAADNTLSQGFFRDPDGYYIELCNCHLLTDFVLGGESGSHDESSLSTYVEGSTGPLAPVATLAVKAQRAKKSRANPTALLLVQPLPEAEQPPEADPIILQNLIKRRLVYGDLCQSFTEQELATILRESGNDCPKAILLMQRHLNDWCRPRVFAPPAYFVQLAACSKISGGRFVPQAFVAPVLEDASAWMTAGLRSLHMQQIEAH